MGDKSFPKISNSSVMLPDSQKNIVNYTITPYRVNDRTHRKAKDLLLGMVQIDGSNTSIIYRLLNLDSSEVKIGMKVRIEWVEKPKGDPSDIKGFKKI